MRQLTSTERPGAMHCRPVISVSRAPSRQGSWRGPSGLSESPHAAIREAQRAVGDAEIICQSANSNNQSDVGGNGRSLERRSRCRGRLIERLDACASCTWPPRAPGGRAWSFRRPRPPARRCRGRDRQLTDVLAELQRADYELQTTPLSIALVHALAATGRVGEALDLADRTIAQVNDRGDLVYLAEALRAKAGGSGLDPAGQDTAEAALGRGTRRRRRQAARGWELRAAVDLATLTNGREGMAGAIVPPEGRRRRIRLRSALGGSRPCPSPLMRRGPFRTASGATSSLATAKPHSAKTGCRRSPRVAPRARPRRAAYSLIKTASRLHAIPSKRSLSSWI